MCEVTSSIIKAVMYVAKQFVSNNSNIEFNELLQEGLTACLPNKVKPGQQNSYYQLIAYRGICKYLKKENLHGIVINNHGGDRKSKKFACSKKTIKPKFISLDNSDLEQDIY